MNTTASKPAKLKKCKECKGGFVPSRPLQYVCSPICGINYSRKLNEKKEAKARKEDTKQRKENLKTHKDWLKDLQTVFNQFIRERDKNEGCISCGTKKTNIQYAAGHFFTVGGFPNVRFDQDNVHKQCNKKCNLELSGNIQDYRPRLIEKIGIERFEALELRARSQPLKLSIPEIKDLIREYRQKIKQLKNTTI